MAVKTHHYTLDFTVDHDDASDQPLSSAALFDALMARVAKAQTFNALKEAVILVKTEDKNPSEEPIGDEKCGRESFAVIQVGGSSTERDVLIHSSERDARAARVSCAKEGGYKTSEVIVIPAVLGMFGGTLYSVLDQMAVASIEVGFPEDAEDVESKDAEA